MRFYLLWSRVRYRNFKSETRYAVLIQGKRPSFTDAPWLILSTQVSLTSPVRYRGHAQSRGVYTTVNGRRHRPRPYEVSTRCLCAESLNGTDIVGAVFLRRGMCAHRSLSLAVRPSSELLDTGTDALRALDVAHPRRKHRRTVSARSTARGALLTL